MENLKQFALEKEKLIVAHRGASGEQPENSLIAIEKAIQQGADMIEIDIQITADNEVIVFHDDYLGRTAPGNNKISEVNFEDIKNLDAGTWFSEQFKDEKIPLLNEVIDLINGKAYLLLELKSYKDPNFAEKFQFIKELLYERDFIPMTLLASFDYNLLKRIKNDNKNFNTAGIKIPDKFINPLELNEVTSNDVFICSAQEYNSELDEIIVKNNLFAGVYGVDDLDTLNNLNCYNIKAFGTNYPALLKKHINDNNRK
jgi:glycerophosphoryl diester phosphodiesterase